MSRRRALRRPRRVQVHFWKQGEPTTYVGYTTNISMTGMFVATNSPMPSGSRIRIEVIGERGFMLEGMVAHARKIRSDLARLNESGMGVRFLSVEELISEVIPDARGKTEEIPQSAGRAPAAPSSPPPPITEPAARAAEHTIISTPPTPPLSPAPSPFRQAAREPVRSPVSSPTTAGTPAAATGGTFSVHFSNPGEFLEVYRRDILQGGLFVSTLYPARLQETVSVELFPPAPFSQPVLVRARVVQRFEPHHGDGAGFNPLAGMGLELIDLPALVERLQPIVHGLRG
ncbi:MAG TPA: PilZ domain-containing protein [Thermoanaerobaculia bacterium]|jgi:hypothetical protein